MPPFMALPPGKTFGDYQILFDLFPNFDFKTYVPQDETDRHSFQDIEYSVMCLSTKVMKHLCWLYPSTAMSLKYRALDRRNYFLKTMQDQE